MKKMLDIFKYIRSSRNDKSEVNIINVISDVYSPDCTNYMNKKEEVLKLFQGRSKELYQDIVLFSIFDLFITKDLNVLLRN